MKSLILISLLFSLSGCAYLVKSERQQVFFNGGQEKAKTTIQTPDGKFEIENGTGTYLMTRSKSNVPVKITCPNGTTKDDIIETKFDWLAGGAGNIMTLGWGWFVDPFSDKGYDYPKTISLARYCQ